MTTTTNTTESPRNYGISLTDAGGNMLRLAASRKKRGAVSQATHSTSKAAGRVRTRGASERHATFEAAIARVEELVSAATKAGWKATRSVDSFDAAHLPAPATAKATPTKTTAKKR